MKWKSIYKEISDEVVERYFEAVKPSDDGGEKPESRKE